MHSFLLCIVWTVCERRVSQHHPSRPAAAIYNTQIHSLSPLCKKPWGALGAGTMDLIRLIAERCVSTRGSSQHHHPPVDPTAGRSHPNWQRPHHATSPGLCPSRPAAIVVVTVIRDCHIISVNTEHGPSVMIGRCIPSTPPPSLAHRSPAHFREICCCICVI